MSLLRKVMVMALLGALGAAFGAALGEGLFSQVAQRGAPRRICLLFDISGSMAETVRRENGGRITQLQALKDAACDFIDRQDLSSDFIGLAVFSSSAQLVCSPSHDAGVLKKSIRGLWADGGTNLGAGFDAVHKVLAGETGERFALVFTDGKPETTTSPHESPQAAALSAAERLRTAGVKIVAIGTPLADADLLAKAAGNATNVIVSDAAALARAFERSEEVINSQMLASSGASGFRRNALTTGIWTALVAVGAGIGLVIAQNRHTRRRALSVREAVLVGLGGSFSGFAAGVAGQSIYYVLSRMPAMSGLGRVAAWSLLGCGLGYAMGYFVPNLKRRRAGIAGGAACLFAALCFMILVRSAGDTTGRLLGAAIFGLAIGLMTVIIEASFREAWVVVHWSARERTTLTLGGDPILVGASSEAHVLIAEEDSPKPIMARIAFKGGTVVMAEANGRERTLRKGEIVEFGRIRIEICGSGAGAFSGPERTSGKGDRVEQARAREGKWHAEVAARDR